MIECLLREMGFLIENSINYDPHHVISSRRQTLKRNPFKHFEFEGLSEATNWSHYPHETQKDIDIHEDSTSYVREITSPWPGISNLVSVAEKITPLSSCSERTNKRYFSDVMDTEEEDTARTPKKQRIEEEGQLVQVTKEDRGKKKMKVIGPSFEVNEYAFTDTPADSTSQFKNKTELLEKYKETKDIA